MGSTSERMSAVTVANNGTLPAGMIPVEATVAAMLAEVIRAWRDLDGARRGKVIKAAPWLGAALAKITPESLSAAARADLPTFVDDCSPEHRFRVDL